MAILESEKYITKASEMSEEELNSEWKAQISIYDPKADKFVANIEMDENETCTAMTYCEVREEQKIAAYLILACATGLTYYPSMGAVKPCLKVY